MAIVTHFPQLSSSEAAQPNGIWGWARRLIDALNRWKLFNLMDLKLIDHPYCVVRVNADGTDFELVPEELGLAGQVLTGLGNQIIRVKPTEDGYEIDMEVLHDLIGIDLTGKANQLIRVNATEDGYVLSKEVLSSLVGVSLSGKAYNLVRVNSAANGHSYDSRLNSLFSLSLTGQAGKAVIVNAGETGFTIAP